MKNKIICIILAVLSVLFLGSGIYGLINHPKEDNKETQKKTEIIKNEITYKYFLDDLEEQELPVSTEENKLIFSKYECTNNITGNFNSNTWKFETNENQKGECKLYFVNSKYEVTLNIINGIEDENNLKFIERNSDGEFKIIPNEGYKYKEAICSNNKTGDWDSSTNTFKINAINSDIACTLSFEKKDLRVDILVNNGKGAVSEKVYYGDSKTMIVEPSDGYGNPTIECTNDQEAKFENNSINFEKILNDTKCTITFKKNEVIKYYLEIKNPTEYEKITIEQGSEKNTNILKGTSSTIILKSNDETIIPTLNCKNESGSPIVPKITGDTTRTFEFLDINTNINCTIGIANK